MDLLELLEADGFRLKLVSRTKNGEYAGPCPWCGGTDRFRVWPGSKGGRYWCRQCEKKGDGIQYLRDFRGLSYREACLVLGEAPKHKPTSAWQRRAHTPPKFTPKESAPAPDVRWRKEAKQFLGLD